jgi:hypothetical protein
VGVVEEPGLKEKKAFHNLYELWDILNLPPKKKRSNSGDGRGQHILNK